MSFYFYHFSWKLPILKFSRLEKDRDLKIQHPGIKSSSLVWKSIKTIELNNKIMKNKLQFKNTIVKKIPTYLENITGDFFQST